MEQSGVVGLTIEGQAERIVSFREAPFCTQLVLAEMMGVDQITEDVVRGWVETYTLPTVKIGRRRVINLHRIRRDIERGKSVFCQRKGDRFIFRPDTEAVGGNVHEAASTEGYC